MTTPNRDVVVHFIEDSGESEDWREPEIDEAGLARAEVWLPINAPKTASASLRLEAYVKEYFEARFDRPTKAMGDVLRAYVDAELTRGRVLAEHPTQRRYVWPEHQRGEASGESASPVNLRQMAQELVEVLHRYLPEATRQTP